MTELQQYIDRQNAFRTLFKKPEITLPLSHDDREYLLDQLECDLSPENLCCDGELRGAELKKKQAFLDAVSEQLARA